VNPWYYLAILVALVAVGPFAVLYVVERLTGYETNDERLSAPEALRDVPDPTWDTPTDLPRARLHSVPLTPSLTLVPDPPVADDEWVFAADLFVPEQRRSGWCVVSTPKHRANVPVDSCEGWPHEACTICNDRPVSGKHRADAESER
jgi:hypothetical protein